MIIAMGYVTVAPCYLNDFNADIQTLASSTRLQEGCLFYVINMEDQSTGRMLIVERWHSQEALDMHLKRVETATFIEKWSNKMDSTIMKYDASNERGLMA